MSQKIVGNFVVGTVYCRDDAGKWNSTWMVRRYGVNNGQVLALETLAGGFGSCEEARDQAMAKGEAWAKGLDADAVAGRADPDRGSRPGGDGRGHHDRGRGLQRL